MTNEFHEEVETTQENTALNEEITQEPTPVEKRSAKKKKLFVPGFVGGVTGGLLAVIIGLRYECNRNIKPINRSKITTTSTSTVKTSPTAYR